MSADNAMILEVFDKEVRPFLDLIDQFRSFGVQKDNIELPQICVMGDQSSGKSSVLEAISGISFPKGSGLVTRCPTELMMSKSPPGSKWEAHASINWSKPQPPGTGPVISKSKLTEVINNLTQVLTNGNENTFSTDSIVIKISSPDSPDLTIIDLPGIVRTVTAGQDPSVISQVNELINSFMAQPRTIILAVIPANQDVATIDILERAAKIDTMGVRTIGVLTKPDLINPGGEDEVIQVLRNVRKPLALGYIMVKNPSQKEANDKITQKRARENEVAFFRSHSEFSKLEPSLFGTQNLIVALTKVLVSNIKIALPDIKRQLETQLAASSTELSSLGKGVPSDERDMQALVMHKISEFCKTVRQSSRGSYREGILATMEEARLHIQMKGAYAILVEEIKTLRPEFDPDPNDDDDVDEKGNDIEDTDDIPGQQRRLERKLERRRLRELKTHEEEEGNEKRVGAKRAGNATADELSIEDKVLAKVQQKAEEKLANRIKEQSKAAEAATAKTTSKSSEQKQNEAKTADGSASKEVEAVTKAPGPKMANDLSLNQRVVQDLVEMRGRELSVFLNSQVLITNIIALVELWRPHMENCKAEIVQYARSVCGVINNTVFGAFPELKSSLDNLLNIIIDGITDKITEKTEALIQREQDPFTAQDVLLNVVNRIRFQAFENALQKYLDSAGEYEFENDMTMLKEDLRKKFGDWYMQRHGVNSTGNVHEMVTLIQAYWDLASRRFVDNVCMCFETELTNEFIQELETQCFLFGVSMDRETMYKMLIEDASMQQRRVDLADKVDRLGKAIKALKECAPEIQSSSTFTASAAVKTAAPVDNSKKQTQQNDDKSTTSSTSSDMIKSATDSFSYAVNAVSAAVGGGGGGSPASPVTEKSNGSTAPNSSGSAGSERSNKASSMSFWGSGNASSASGADARAKESDNLYL